MKEQYEEKDKLLVDKRKEIDEERGKIQKEIADGTRSTKRSATLVVILSLILNAVLHFLLWPLII